MVQGRMRCRARQRAGIAAGPYRLVISEATCLCRAAGSAARGRSCGRGVECDDRGHAGPGELRPAWAEQCHGSVGVRVAVSVAGNRERLIGLPPVTREERVIDAAADRQVIRVRAAGRGAGRRCPRHHASVYRRVTASRHGEDSSRSHDGQDPTFHSGRTRLGAPPVSRVTGQLSNRRQSVITAHRRHEQFQRVLFGYARVVTSSRAATDGEALGDSFMGASASSPLLIAFGGARLRPG